MFNRRSGDKNLGALQKANGPIMTGLQIEVRLDRLVPRDCEVTPQDSKFYTTMQRKDLRVHHELASSVASLWRRTLQSMWESDGCVDVKQLQEEVQRLKGYRLARAHALVTVPDAEVRSHFEAGLSLHTRPSMAACMRRAMLRGWGMRTTMKGYRGTNDGRCRGQNFIQLCRGKICTCVIFVDS